MPSVQVNVHFNAPIEQVFAAVSDHERFLNASDTRTKLLQPGTTERNGLGCIREVAVGRRAWYVEEITAWEKPAYFEYTIRRASMPMRHEGSRLSFAAVAGGTDVQWTSRFTIPFPILGRFIGVMAVRLYSKAFTKFLNATRLKLEKDLYSPARAP